jgi:DNA-binding transcriptional regulator/RsmH inhibitor MraZ
VAESTGDALHVLQAPRYDEGYEHLGQREERTVDDKGRVILPAGAWRDVFADGARLTLFRGCIALWTLRSYGAFVAQLHADQRLGKHRPDTVEAFRAETRHISLDGQGRLTLPAELRELVGIGGQGSSVVIEGQGDRLEFRPADRTGRMSAADLYAELQHVDH